MTIEFAKALHKAGYRSLAMIAASDEKKLVQALRQQGTRGGGRVAGSYKHVERSARALHEEALKVEAERDEVRTAASTGLTHDASVPACFSDARCRLDFCFGCTF